VTTIAGALRIGVLLVIGGALLEPPQNAPVTWADVLSQRAEWFGTEEARRIADRVLDHQRGDGGWPKNTDMTAPPDQAVLAAARAKPDSTIDNGATVAANSNIMVWAVGPRSLVETDRPTHVRNKRCHKE